MIYALLFGFGFVCLAMGARKTEQENTQLRRRNAELVELNEEVLNYTRKIEERNEAVATQPAYFFLSGHFGPSVADEINFLDHHVLMGFISVEEYNEKVSELIQPYMDIRYA